MTPRKKQYGTPTEGQRAYEDRLKAAGKRRVCLWVSEEAAGYLKMLAADRSQTQGEVVEALIQAEAEGR
ncbi:hypothetical protein [Endothiovibrio diazotrophicus]